MAFEALASVDRMLTILLESNAIVSRNITMDPMGIYPENISGDIFRVKATLDPSAKLITIDIQGKEFKGEYPQSTLANEVHHVYSVWKQTAKVKRKVNWFVYTTETEETVETGITLQLVYHTNDSMFVPDIHTFTVQYNAKQ
jgi:hypothetical protein